MEMTWSVWLSRQIKKSAMAAPVFWPRGRGPPRGPSPHTLEVLGVPLLEREKVYGF